MNRTLRRTREGFPRVIRRLAQERGAVPATAVGTEHDGGPGVLTFDFPPPGDDDRLTTTGSGM